MPHNVIHYIQMKGGNYATLKKGDDQMETTLPKLIQRHKIKLARQNGMISIRGKIPSPSEMAKIRELKPQIIACLETTRQKEKEERIQEEIERKKEYEPLITKLKKREFPSLNDDTKAKEILCTISTRYFRGSEDDGLNLSILAQNGKIRAEARKYCQHELKISYWHTYTADGRRKIERTISCPKCRIYIVDVAEESIPIETASGM